MDLEDHLQVWSFDDARIVRVVASDFVLCLYDDQRPQDVGTLEMQGPDHLPGDMRAHYATSCSSLWKRIT